MSDTKRYTMTSFIMKLRETGQKHPIFVILSIAFIFRLFVAILLPDSGDFNIRERFLYFKMPIAWIDESTEYLSSQTYDEPQGISLFYLSLNYAWLALFKFIGINDISWLTFIGRLLHTFISLLVISFGYRMAELLSNKRTAIMVASALALFWFMPFVSIQTIPAFVCITFLMYATLIILRQEINRYESRSTNVHRTSFIIAGFFLGLGFSTYYLCMPYILGIILALMLRKNIKNALTTLLGFIISISIALVVPDLLVWGKPFAELTVFIENAPELTFFKTFSLLDIAFIMLALILPLSIMLLCGFFKNWKKKLLLFLPTIFTILFFILSNTDAWFLLPALPLFLLLGITGWKEIIDNSSFWQKHITLHKVLIGISLFFNFTLFLLITIIS